MAFEKLLQLLSKAEAVDAKLDEVMSLLMLATADMVESEQLTPGDPEWKAITAHAEEMSGKAARSAEMSTRMAAENAMKPGGEAVAEAHRRMAAGAVALGARTQEFAALMRDVGALMTLSDSAGWPAVRRCRKPNTRYFGPEWSN